MNELPHVLIKEVGFAALIFVCLMLALSPIGVVQYLSLTNPVGATPVPISSPQREYNADAKNQYACVKNTGGGLYLSCKEYERTMTPTGEYDEFKNPIFGVGQIFKET